MKNYIWVILCLCYFITNCSRETTSKEVKTSTYYKYNLVVEKHGPPTWEYSLPAQCPFVDSINPGDKVKIWGKGVSEALVTNEATTDKFGAWCVKEITPDYVVFEATTKVIVNQSILRFVITAPKSLEGEIPWKLYNDNGSVFEGFFVSGPTNAKN